MTHMRWNCLHTNLGRFYAKAKNETVLCKQSRNLICLSFYIFLILHDLKILLVRLNLNLVFNPISCRLLGLLATPEDDVTAGAAGIGCACGSVIIGCACLGWSSKIQLCKGPLKQITWYLLFPSFFWVHGFSVLSQRNKVRHRSLQTIKRTPKVGKWISRVSLSEILQLKLKRELLLHHQKVSVQQPLTQPKSRPCAAFSGLTSNTLHEGRGLQRRGNRSCAKFWCYLAQHRPTTDPWWFIS